MSQRSRSSQIVTLLVLASQLVQNAFALPISQDPDEYDIPKYERLVQQNQREFESIHVRVLDFDQRLRAIDQQIQGEQGELAQMQGALSRAQQIIATSIEQQRRLDQEIDRIRAQKMQLAQELSQIQSQIEQEQRKRDSLAQQIGVAQNRVAEVEREVSQKEQAASGFRREIELAESTVNRLANEVQGLERTLAEAQAALRRAEQEAGQGVPQARANLNSERAKKERVDADARSRRSEAQQKEQEAQAKESEALEAERNNSPNARELRHLAARTRHQAERAKAEAEQAERAVTVAAAAVANAEAELAQAERNERDSAQKIEQARREVARAQNHLDQRRGTLNEARQSLSSIQARAQGVLREVEIAKQRLREAQSVLANLREEHRQSEQRLANLVARPAQLQRELAQLDSAIERVRNEINQHQAQANEAQVQVQRLVPRIREQQNQIANLINGRNQVAVERERWARAEREAYSQVERAMARLEQVRQNLANGIQVAAQMGHAQGSEDGHIVGSRQGTERGARDGQDVGTREGREQGTADGRALAQQRGQEKGQNEGTAAGEQKGASDGPGVGQRDGLERGRIDGLLAGYESGRRDGDARGYTQGTEIGHTMGGYEKGKTEGLAQGTARGERNGAQKGAIDGYARGEQEFLNAPLAEVTLPNRVQAQAASFEPPSVIRFANAGIRFPHPAMTQEYERTYQAAHASAAAAAYDTAYARVYRDNYDRSYTIAYERAKAADFSNDYDQSYNQSFRVAYDRAYHQAYTLAYNAAFEVAHAEAHRRAFPTRVEEGKRDGFRDGLARGKEDAFREDFNRGKSDGDQLGYDAAYQIAYTREDRASYARAIAFYSTNAVIKPQGAVLMDANQDAVFAPNEKVAIDLSALNFGKVSQAVDITVTVESRSAALVVEQAEDLLAKIPGQSRSTVTGITALRVNANAVVGAPLAAVVRLSQAGRLLAEYTLQARVGLPYSVLSFIAPEQSVAEVNNTIAVEIKNVSSKTSSQAVVLRLVSTDGLAQTGEAVVLGKLTAGQVARVPLSFTFTAENAFKQLIFEVQVLEQTPEGGDWLLGSRSGVVDSTRRWSYSAQSLGLVLVQNRTLGLAADQAMRAMGLAFDLWDTRVEGPLSAAVALQYQDKLVVIPGVDGDLDVSTAQALSALIEKDHGAHARFLVKMEEHEAGSAVGRVLQNLVQDQSVGRNSSTLATNLTGLKVSEPNVFVEDAQKAVILQIQGRLSDLKSNLWVAQVLIQELPQKLAFLKTLNAVTTHLSLRASASAQVLVKELILRDLIREMKDDQEVSGKHFKKDRKDLMLTHFVQTAVTTRDQALIAMYPALKEAVSDVSRVLRRHRIHKVLAPLKNAFEAQSNRAQ